MVKEINRMIFDILDNGLSQEGKDLAYFERDILVSLLSKLYPSHLARHPDSDVTWENDWRNIVCVHLPTGQATWHIHDSELPFFEHLTMKENHWDGHSNLDKYGRIIMIRGK